MEQQLKAIGDKARLRILKLLPLTDEDCEALFNVTELSEELGIPQPTVSHHLNVLRNAGLVRNRKMCRDVYYWIDREAVDNLTSQLEQIFYKK
ncbi:MAG: metalloregulator ArsR/SmtB family transcription factor [Clostridia bacterium]|nr:metalloregulator ArsR/SmtB family transcription factor [Clostridia bacterium]